MERVKFLTERELKSKYTYSRIVYLIITIYYIQLYKSIYKDKKLEAGAGACRPSVNTVTSYQTLLTLYIKH